MKKVFIIAYYAYPCNAIGANRINTLAELLHEKGCDVTIVTRSWTGNERNWDDYIATSEKDKIERRAFNGVKVINLPHTNKIMRKSAIGRKLDILLGLLTGRLQIEVDVMPFWNFLDTYIKSDKPDLIFTSCEPYNSAKLAYKIYQKFKIPYIVDFRDYFNHFTMTFSHKGISFYQKLEYWFSEYYMKKWCSKAVLVSSVTEPIADHLAANFGVESLLITNGYEEDKFNNLEPKVDKDHMVMSIIGHINRRQSIDEMIEGFRILYKKINNPAIKLLFVGVSSDPMIADRLRKELSFTNISILPRLDRSEALSIGKSSDILYYPAYKGYKGFYSGKLFEYLGFKRNIIVSPDNDPLVNNLVRKTGAGKIAKSGEQFAAILENWYNEWLNKGELEYHGNSEEIKKYSRKSQFSKLVNYIYSYN